MKIDEEGFFSEGQDCEGLVSGRKVVIYPQYNLVSKKMSHVKRIKPLSIYQNAELFQYPTEIDNISNYENCRQVDNADEEETSFDKIKQFTDEKEDLYQEMSKQNLVFCKFKDGFQRKKDPTLYIQNVSTLLRSQLLQKFQRNTQQNISDNKLSFMSAFEGGNLHSVFQDKTSPNCYYLLLQSDTNTHGYNQWFNFWVKSGEKIENSYRFIILNISKGLLYKPGMRILEFSEGKWKRKQKFFYYKNKYEKYSGDNFMTIDFQFQPKQTIKTEGVLFSFSFPYTFTKLNNFLRKIEEKGGIIEKIGRTSIKHPIYIYRYLNLEPNFHQQKECIIVIGRQHPCQTVGSFICEQIIKKLCSKNVKTHYNWHIIPMVNIDGVVHGNSRTNLKGYDTNRCWDKQGLQICQQANLINNEILRIKERENIKYIFDFHGHSKQLNSFSYCSQYNVNTAIFNQKMSENCKYFNLKKCQYGLTFDKRQTFRAQMQSRLKIKNCITIETSWYGYQIDNEIKEFTQQNFFNIASAFLKAIEEISEFEKNVEIFKKIQQKLSKNEQLNEAANRKKSIEKDSDSDPEGEYLIDVERKKMEKKNFKNGARQIVKKREKEKKIDSNFSEKIFVYKTEKCSDKVIKDKQKKQNQSLQSRNSGKISLIEIQEIVQTEEKPYNSKKFKTQPKIQSYETQKKLSSKMKAETFIERRSLKNKFNNVLLRAHRKEFSRKSQKPSYLYQPLLYPTKNNIQFSSTIQQKLQTTTIFKEKQKKKLEEAENKILKSKLERNKEFSKTSMNLSLNIKNSLFQNSKLKLNQILL